MKTKSVFLIVVWLSLSMFSQQQFVPKKADIASLANAVLKSDYSIDEVALYFERYYNASTQKTQIKTDPEFNNKECGYTKTYAFGIVYKKEQCGEATSLQQEITFPKASTAQMIQWIEDMYAINPTDIPNIWYESGLEYGPKDREAGCYYTITQAKNKTIVRITCGC